MASISRSFTCTNISNANNRVTLTAVVGSTNQPEGNPKLLMTSILFTMNTDPGVDFWETDATTSYDVLIERMT